MRITFLILMFVLGASMGSFLCCQARRLRLKELSPKKSQPKPLGNRSVCLSCHHQLKWYDNIPILSWLLLKGKCRHCHQKIGALEILSELGLALAFLAVGTTIDISTTSPLIWASFVMTLLLILSLGFLAIYDGAYGELPTLYLTISIICAIIVLILKQWSLFLVSGFSFNLILDPLASVAILGGIYLLLYLISKGKWVGDGDWILGVALGLGLANPWLALITLFLANFLACIVMLPAVKKSKNNKIHFGPFMIIAFVITTSFSTFFISLML